MPRPCTTLICPPPRSQNCTEGTGNKLSLNYASGHKEARNNHSTTGNKNQNKMDTCDRSTNHIHEHAGDILYYDLLVVPDEGPTNQPHALSVSPRYAKDSNNHTPIMWEYVKTPYIPPAQNHVKIQ